MERYNIGGEFRRRKLIHLDKVIYIPISILIIGYLTITLFFKYKSIALFIIFAILVAGLYILSRLKTITNISYLSDKHTKLMHTKNLSLYKVIKDINIIEGNKTGIIEYTDGNLKEWEDYYYTVTFDIEGIYTYLVSEAEQSRISNNFNHLLKSLAIQEFCISQADITIYITKDKIINNVESEIYSNLVDKINQLAYKYKTYLTIRLYRKDLIIFHDRKDLFNAITKVTKKIEHRINSLGYKVNEVLTPNLYLDLLSSIFHTKFKTFNELAHIQVNNGIEYVKIDDYHFASAYIPYGKWPLQPVNYDWLNTIIEPSEKIINVKFKFIPKHKTQKKLKNEITYEKANLMDRANKVNDGTLTESIASGQRVLNDMLLPGEVGVIPNLFIAIWDTDINNLYIKKNYINLKTQDMNIEKLMWTDYRHYEGLINCLPMTRGVI